ncbi:uncharacterized protein EI97DRAFT_444900 [Westerdykella ornata]|uniref:Uncharacterized protein n=1 Tax=Westerdykella ornata TaxID=318751 RepID=A0A6A6JB18_WESOR|nr:uncharacterized protein EI97DRAFT_444900 [Westerdykella ornata]KAF2273612.1 hypothetical protein EI97DRAFT_444900 [Westerdykella ornata]
MSAGNFRKSQRIVHGNAIDYRELTPEEHSIAGYSPSKKSVDTSSEFELNSNIDNNDEDDEDYVPSARVATQGRGIRRAAGVARKRIRASQTVSPRKRSPEKGAKEAPNPTASQISPDVIEAARTFEKRVPAKLEPHFLSRTRMIIDSLNVFLYAEQGATDPWKSAFSAYRYNGPRKHAPFRELYRLSDPLEDDISDWAENIRWAKQQYELYGSVWTEYEYSLECITKHRIRSLWASEELIRSGRFPAN